MWWLIPVGLGLVWAMSDSDSSSGGGGSTVVDPSRDIMTYAWLGGMQTSDGKALEKKPAKGQKVEARVFRMSAMGGLRDKYKDVKPDDVAALTKMLEELGEMMARAGTISGTVVDFGTGFKKFAGDAAKDDEFAIVRVDSIKDRGIDGDAEVPAVGEIIAAG